MSHRQGSLGIIPRSTPESYQPESGIQDIREYFEEPVLPEGAPAWLSLPEVPSSDEICRTDEELPIPANVIEGPWPSKDEYLQAHYELIREDAISPLRQTVEEIRANPDLLEVDSYEKSGIYDHVYIVGATLADQGIAIKISFSLNRVNKMIRWDQSKRLVSGTLIALSTKNDVFKSICKVAIVAARPIDTLNANSPTIDIFFGNPQDIEIDPQQEWIMVEARQGYFEAYRHTLKALQKLSEESFSLSDHIVKVHNEVDAPKYIQDQPFIDLRPAMKTEGYEYANVDVLSKWPKVSKARGDQLAPNTAEAQPLLPSTDLVPQTELDASQFEALHRILTKRLAIVQGPPGTGKTFISVTALKTMIASRKNTDPPIVVAAQTNHALDQLLRHISIFESNFVRLGGQTSDQETIKPRTLFEIKKAHPPSKSQKQQYARARKEWQVACDDLAVILKPLSSEDGALFSPETFLVYGLLNSEHCDSLTNGHSEWSGSYEDGPASICAWLGRSIVHVDKHHFYAELTMESEDNDEEFEQLREIEAEMGIRDDDQFETLRGKFHEFRENYACRLVPGISDSKVQDLLKDPNMWNIPQRCRGAVYTYLQKRLKEAIGDNVRRAAIKYAGICKRITIAKWEVNFIYLRQAPIIGLTTTGLSKYRGLLSALKPRVVMIEEAAETLEANVISSCFDSLQHLILVGDHKQLRSQCAVKDLEGKPFYLDVSLFERLIQNNVEFTLLNCQRRMRPEIRELINPIYKDLYDHPSVENREGVPGMNGVNSYFYTHSRYESTDDSMSKRNVDEALMVTGFFSYLVHNGVKPDSITVLTFYNAQRKLILSQLRRKPDFNGCKFKIATVDSYQGEENEIVLLSLVRNNEYGEIGFLSVENRVCVALSRARRGFYIFGHHAMLENKSNLWRNVLSVMNWAPRRFGTSLPVTCKRHNTKCLIIAPHHWEDNNGGCFERCKEVLPCGHKCRLHCHPYAEDTVVCYQPCQQILGCGHTCSEKCHVKPCVCRCNRGGLYGYERDMAPPPGRTWEIPEVQLDVASTTPEIRSQQPSRDPLGQLIDFEIDSHHGIVPSTLQKSKGKAPQQPITSSPQSLSRPSPSPQHDSIANPRQNLWQQSPSPHKSLLSSPQDKPWQQSPLRSQAYSRFQSGDSQYSVGTGPWQAFATGGVVENDKEIDAKRVRDIEEIRKKRAEDATASWEDDLFGNGEGSSSAVPARMSGNGKGSSYSLPFRVGGAENIRSAPTGRSGSSQRISEHIVLEPEDFMKHPTSLLD